MPSLSRHDNNGFPPAAPEFEKEKGRAEATNLALLTLGMNRFLTGLVLVGVWVFFLAVEIAGIDYGLHWDEYKIIQTIRRSVQDQSILPNSYLYPSLVHNVGLLSLGWTGISTSGNRGLKLMGPPSHDRQGGEKTKDGVHD